MLEGKELIIFATEKKLAVQWNIINSRSNHVCNDQKQPNRKLNTGKDFENYPLGARVSAAHSYTRSGHCPPLSILWRVAQV